LGVRDLTWINANGGEMAQSHWKDGNTKCLGMLVDGPCAEYWNLKTRR
jgi:isoamylase